MKYSSTCKMIKVLPLRAPSFGSQISIPASTNIWHFCQLTQFQNKILICTNQWFNLKYGVGQIVDIRMKKLPSMEAVSFLFGIDFNEMIFNLQILHACPLQSEMRWFLKLVNCRQFRFLKGMHFYQMFSEHVYSKQKCKIYVHR